MHDVLVIGRLEMAPFSCEPYLEGIIYGHPNARDGSFGRVQWIERDPSNPSIWVSVSGRRYKLISPD